MKFIRNTLIIGDLHHPFTHPDYLNFCLKVQEDYKCNNVVFIGDLSDFHYSSFHAIEPGAMGCNTEYEKMLEALGEWQRAFPKALITYGNHDLIPFRKGYAGGLGPAMMKSWRQLFNAPKTWTFGESFIIDNVMYTHGTNAAVNRMRDARISVVQGHLHSQQYVIWSQSEINRLFAMQVGCGIDNSAYAFAYGRSFPKKPVLGCGVVLDNGQVPLVIPMHTKKR